MFDWLKKKAQPHATAIRDTLFGDMPLAEWASHATDESSEPWISFKRVHDSIESGDTRSAREVLQQILQMSDLESRHYLQAFHFLREMGVHPLQRHGKLVLGVVVEVGMKGGTDLVAAYADHSARYYSYHGAAIVWERPNDSLDAIVDDLLLKGGIVVAQIGPWEKARRAAPAEGDARINFLTPSGLHFGEASMDGLAKDTLGGPVLAAAFGLMQSLMQLAQRK